MIYTREKRDDATPEVIFLYQSSASFGDGTCMSYLASLWTRSSLMVKSRAHAVAGGPITERNFQTACAESVVYLR